MTQPSEPAPSAWRELRDLVVEFWGEQRAGPQPLPVIYLLCDGCGQVTPRTTVRKILSVSRTEIIGGTPESVCAACNHPQPRVVDDEVPADTTMVCNGHPFRRIGSRRSRKACSKTIAAPAAATLVICPWCITEQPGPGR